MSGAENQLTVKKLSALKPTDKGQTLTDGGGLRGRVSHDSRGIITVAFSFGFRSPETGKQQTKSCGVWPNRSLAEIRAERNRLRELVRNKIDPIEAEKREQQAIEEARCREAALAAEASAEAARLAARMTFHELFERWNKIQLSQRKDGGEEIRRAFGKDVLPHLGPLFADEITRPMIANVLNLIVERGSGRMANRTLSDLRQCFGFAIGAGLLDNDPTSHLKKTAFGGKETERDRILDESELQRLLRESLPASNLSFKARAAVRLLLATAARVGELLKARRTDFDLEKRTWRIPAENAKNAVEHTVYLSDFSMDAVRELLSIIDHPVWLFPDRHGINHVCTKTLTKQVTDRQTTAPMSGRSRDTQSLAMPGGKWTPHDLRRSAATLMGELDVMPHIIELCLNHKEENKVKRTYQRQKNEDAQRQAFDVLGKKLRELSGNEQVSDNQTDIARAFSEMLKRKAGNKSEPSA